jgi:hypothetical protein
MKKITKATKAQRTLTQQDLGAVRGGTEGAIIVANGVGGTGKVPGGIIRPNDTGISGGG